ncbi:hypothetical protein AtubIFM57258_007998 [Aspergillus tubingensis]|nr:hypothetical protein AtubIFM57258_007998 [Aspergillus tubingensis]
MRNTFADLTEYDTCLHNALVYEKEAKDKAARDLAEGYCKLLVVAVPNLGNPGQSYEVIFDMENSAPEKRWRTVIMENISFTSPGFCILGLTRPWNRETGIWVDLPVAGA